MLMLDEKFWNTVNMRLDTVRLINRTEETNRFYIETGEKVVLKGDIVMVISKNDIGIVSDKKVYVTTEGAVCTYGKLLSQVLIEAKTISVKSSFINSISIENSYDKLLSDELVICIDSGIKYGIFVLSLGYDIKIRNSVSRLLNPYKNGDAELAIMYGKNIVLVKDICSLDELVITIFNGKISVAKDEETVCGEYDLNMGQFVNRGIASIIANCLDTKHNCFKLYSNNNIVKINNIMYDIDTSKL